MKIRIVPYKRGSKSARLLAEELSKILRYTVFRGEPKKNRQNIMWGIPNGVGVDKLQTFEAFKRAKVSCPEFTTDRNIATGWLKECAIVGRKFLRSQGGKGAEYHEKGSKLTPALLYVKYIPKAKEFRVHIVNGKVILVQEKRQRKGSKVDYKIRSHENDWVFCFQNIVEPKDLRKVALDACAAVGHGGAVDIVWNEKKNKCFALEVNSAPGLCPTSAQIYAKAIVNEFKLLQKLVV